MSATVRFKDVEAMLNECAPGWSWQLATHSRVVTYNAKTYRALPKHENIEIGHVRKMIRYLRINEECAQKHLGT